MKLKVGLITLQIRESLSAFEIYLKLMKVLESFSTEIAWIATNYLGDDSRLPENVTLKKLKSIDIDKGLFIKRIPRYLWREMKIVLQMIKIRDVDVFIFYCGYLPLFPVLFAAFFLRRKTVLRIDGRSSVIVRSGTRPDTRDNRLIRIMIHSFIEKIDYSLADKIAVEYESMVERYNLQEYLQKIALGNQYIDTNLFKPTRNLKDRGYLLGYFGRLSQEKGVLELARALSVVLKDGKNRAIIVGGGELYEEVESILIETGIKGQVEIVSWVALDEMPAYLNDTRLAVVPSYMEGVPNIVLEAMACGTPVLATAVGGIPDVIIDGETGFIMEDKSPECIARNVSRVLSHQAIEEITSKARAIIDDKYTYEVVVENYRKILTN